VAGYLEAGVMIRVSDALPSGLSLLGSAVPRIPTGVPFRVLVLPFGAVVLLGGLVFFNSRAPLQTLVFAVVFGSFIFIANHRVWAVVPVLLADHTIAIDSLGPLGGLGLRITVTALAAALTLPVLLSREGRAALGEPSARRVLVPSVAFIAISTVINLLFSELPYVIKYLRLQTVIFVAAVLLIVLVRDRRALAVVTSAVFVVSVLSALVAIGQSVGGGLAWYATPSGVAANEARVSGLTQHPVHLQLNLGVAAVTTLAVLGACWPFWPRGRFVLLFGSAIMLLATYLTTTRSAIFAVVAGVATIALLDARCRLHIVVAMVTGALLFGVAVASGVVDERFKGVEDSNGSGVSHIALAQVAIAITLDNALLGIGHQHFPSVARGYRSEVDVAGGRRVQTAVDDTIGEDRPHNDVLDVWSSWGILGLLSYVAVFAGALLNLSAARNSALPLLRGLAVGCTAGPVAHAVGSLFHNYLDGSAVLWCYAALSAPLCVLSAQTARHAVALRRGSGVAPGRRAGAADPST
jgi:O-antigen ligase